MALPVFRHSVDPDPFHQAVIDAVTVGTSVVLKMEDGSIHHINGDRVDFSFDFINGPKTGHGLFASKHHSYD